MMGDSLRLFQSKKLELRISAAQNLPKSRLIGSFANKSPRKTLKCIASVQVSMVATGGASDIGAFLLTTAALEIVRRFSSAKYPFIWRGLQALQLLCCPPFKWIQKWAPFTGLVKGMQALSRPLMFLSVATGFFDESGSSGGRHLNVDLSDPTLQLSTQDARPVGKVSRSVTENWLAELYAELDKQGISIPERLNEDELHRFYAISEGDFARFLSSVKKTIRWRQRYTLLSRQELESWVKLVFWHGSDMMQRPCLIIRIGLAISSLASNGQAQFVRAVVSQVEYGVLNLLDVEHHQLTVLMDCEGLSPFGFPLKTFRSCAILLQDHYPNRLGCLLIVRLPSIARVITQTLFQVLKPRTQQKLTIVGENYQQVLSKYFEELPPFLGGKCSCAKCANEVEPIIERTSTDLTVHHLEGTSSGSELYADSNILDINREHVKVVAVGALLLWVCVVFVLSVYYRQLVLPQFYDKSGS